MKIALDAMGGDHSPQSPVAGAVEALRDFPDVEILLVGDQARLESELSRHETRAVQARLQIRHASQVVDMADSGLDSVRRKKDSSISRAIDLVKSGEAEAVVSAGHTGALVAAATIKLRTLPGIDRAALGVLIPADGGVFLLIDGGANLDPSPEHIVGFAVMGSVYYQAILGGNRARVGLLNIGTEPTKGTEFAKQCFARLQEAPILFSGNIEGHGIFKKPVEVVVCDGFTGNIFLKSIEGLAKAMVGWIKDEMQKSPVRIAGALLCKGAFQAVKSRTSTEEYGGTPLLGVNGICIKAHGNSSPVAIRNAIRAARSAVKNSINSRIVEAMQPLHENPLHRESPAA